ncbi:MAG TPA: hypothetical protein VFN24_13460 [Microbacterium sp.]|nr:hypothetical protein [Microbacterium sp.]
MTAESSPDDTDATRLSARRVADAGDTVRLPGRGTRAEPAPAADAAPARIAHSPDVQALRETAPPRSADPLRVERAAPAPRTPQPPVDGADLARSHRRWALRRALWVAVAAALVVAIAATLLVVVLWMPR